MTNTKRARDRATKRIRWIARGVGSFVGALFLFVLIVSAIADPEPPTLEGMILGGLVAIAVLTVPIAWWREGVGGTAMVICAIGLGAFALVTAGFNHAFAMLVSGGPWLVSGALFLAAWWRSTRSRKGA